MSRLRRLQQISDCSVPIRMIGVSYAYRRHFVICKPFVCFQPWIQPVDATDWLNRSAGVS